MDTTKDPKDELDMGAEKLESSTDLAWEATKQMIPECWGHLPKDIVEAKLQVAYNGLYDIPNNRDLLNKLYRHSCGEVDLNMGKLFLNKRKYSLIYNELNDLASRLGCEIRTTHKISHYNRSTKTIFIEDVLLELANTTTLFVIAHEYRHAVQYHYKLYSKYTSRSNAMRRFLIDRLAQIGYFMEQDANDWATRFLRTKGIMVGFVKYPYKFTAGLRAFKAFISLPPVGRGKILNFDGTEF